MKLSRISLGLAVRAARESARLTLADLAPAMGLTVSSLSRTETGQRDLTFAEVLLLAKAVKVTPEVLRDLAETFERSGASEAHGEVQRHATVLNELQRIAIEAAIEARSDSDAT